VAGKRFVLTYKGKGPAPSVLGELQRVPGLNVLDASLGRMVLVEGPEEKIRPLIESMPDWSVTPETTVPLPDPRPKIRSAPRGSKKKTT
jgi:hypothetical protein